jgi:hypothetical protein
MLHHGVKTTYGRGRQDSEIVGTFGRIPRQMSSTWSVPGPKFEAMSDFGAHFLMPPRVPAVEVHRDLADRRRRQLRVAASTAEGYGAYSGTDCASRSSNVHPDGGPRAFPRNQGLACMLDDAIEMSGGDGWRVRLKVNAVRIRPGGRAAPSLAGLSSLINVFDSPHRLPVDGVRADLAPS